MSNKITTPYDKVLIDPNEPLILPDGTAITGRLETFLYALCCLDYDNLPTPLSRIEEFANALITNEIPNIEPQSRSEQFFLAILDGNIDNLPEPQSRSEVLLNKLAVGDFDLTNVDTIQSRYELLLAYLIKNGGVGNLDYVLYEFYQATQTLYNTVEKPVKSAVLNGNTMINYAQITAHNFDENRTPVQNLNKPLEKGKIYTIIMNIVSQTAKSGITTRFAKDNKGYIGVKTFNGVGIHKYQYTATDDFNQFAPYVDNGEYQSGLSAEYNQLMILEGDYTNTDIPYFEGMQSVKMPVLTATGKNLFDINGELKTTLATYSINGDSLIVTGDWFAYQDVNLKPNTTYTLSCQSVKSESGYFKLGVYYNNLSTSVVVVKNTKKLTFTTPSTFNDISVLFYAEEGNGTNTTTYTNIQLEENSVATTYEPFKSNILTVNEDVELRGIGDVKDELDLLTGEVTQRIGEVVFNGNEDWMVDTTTNDFLLYHRESMPKSPLLVSIQHFNLYKGQGAIVTKLKNTSYENIGLEEFKQYLSQNPITVNYRLATESVKTIDLSVVDQDGNNTKLSTFNDITHVTLSSEGLIPEAELEVATKNEEVLNTLSLEMDDISTAQTTLEKTSNVQSENVDATMIATTEIYEGLL